MWALIALEEIEKGAFLGEYVGEIITHKTANDRGVQQEKSNFNFLFDMSSPSEGKDFEILEKNLKKLKLKSENIFPLW